MPEVKQAPSFTPARIEITRIPVKILMPRKAGERHLRCYQCGNRLGKRHLDSEICGDCERGIEGAAFKRIAESELSATEEETLA